MLSSRLVVAALGWTGTLLIARTLTVRDFGSWAFVFNMLGLLGLLADFQTSRIVMREVVAAGDDLEDIVGRFFLFRVALGSVTYCIAITLVVVGPFSGDVVRGAAIGGCSFFIASGLWSLIMICQARLWLRSVAFALAFAQLVQLGITIALVVAGVDTLVPYVVPAIVNDAVALAVLMIALRKVLRVRPRVDLRRWWRWLREAAPLALGSAMGTLYFRIDGVMLSMLLPRDEWQRAVAQYQIGYKFSDLLGFLAPALIGAVLPLLVRAWPSDPEGFRRTWRHASILVVAFSVFAAITFAILAKPVITTLYGGRYDLAARPARLLVVGQSLNFLTQLVFVTLVASGRRRFYPLATLLGVVVNVSLNLVLIPRYKVMGSAWATIVTEIVVVVALGLQARELPLRPLPVRAGAVVLAAGATVAGLLLLLGDAVPWPAAALLGAAAFIAVLHVLRLDGAGGIPAFLRESRVDLAPAAAAAAEPGAGIP